jgi:hypothetical protein
MGGGLMQLVAYGAQDIYLTGNPQITFFKVVYRRHTNFSMEAIEQTMLGTPGSGTSQTSTISRNGDLIHKMYFEVRWNTTQPDTESPGAYMIDNVELEIGGQMIDRHTGDWMETWTRLTEASRISEGGTNNTVFSEMAAMGTGTYSSADADTDYFVPLQFWFCRNTGLALPLIALQYHEVKLKVKWSTNADIPSTCKLYVDYIYLDTDERRRFAQVSHEYLIEQLQYQSLGASKINELNFNHPVKELVWKRNPNSGDDFNQQSINKDYNFHLTLNGHDRFSKRSTRYFTHLQVWQYHSGTIVEATQSGDDTTVIAVYSFALKPEEHQPSGTCNFSRIDNAQLVCDNDFEGAGTIYAVNYNVLRIMSGMGGLAYSN